MPADVMDSFDTDDRRGGLAWTRRFPRLHRNVNRAVAGLFLLFALIQVYMRFLSNQPWGPSIPNLITQSMIALGTLVALGWLILCSRWSRGVVWAIALPVLLGIIAVAASTRRVNFDGNMAMSFEWRWQPTNDDVLQAWRSNSAAMGDGAVEAVQVSDDDMPAYRGVHRNGVVIGPPLNDDWTKTPPQVLWKHPVGGGYGQFAVVGGLAITLEQRRDQETLVCYDASTGGELWSHGWTAKFDEAMGGPGPRSTPTVAEGRVYALGANGHLACVDLAKGKPVWEQELLQDLQLVNSMWGMTSSPLVVDQQLIVNLGGYYGEGLVALDGATGEIVWKTEGLAASRFTPPPLVAAALKQRDELPPATDSEHAAASSSSGRNFAGYASPMLVTIDGTRQILNFDGMGLWGHALEDGHPLWFDLFTNGPGVNSAQPIVFPDGRILISASYDVGSRMLRVTHEGKAWHVEPLWGGGEKPNRQLRSKMSTPVLAEGYIYGLDEGTMVCIDPANGKRLWKGSREYPSTGRYGHGQLLVSNGLLVLLTEKGDLVLLRPQPDKLVELGSMHVLDGEKTWNPPALVRGKLYLRNHHQMACVDLCSTPGESRSSGKGVEAP